MAYSKVASKRELQLLSLLTVTRSGRELRKHTHLPHATVYTALNEMEDRGWIVSDRIKDGDRRGKQYKLDQEAGGVALTDAVEYYDVLARLAQDTLNDLYAPRTAKQELAELDEALEKLKARRREVYVQLMGSKGVPDETGGSEN